MAGKEAAAAHFSSSDASFVGGRTVPACPPAHLSFCWRRHRGLLLRRRGRRRRHGRAAASAAAAGSSGHAQPLRARLPAAVSPAPISHVLRHLGRRRQRVADAAHGAVWVAKHALVRAVRGVAAREGAARAVGGG